MAITAILPYFDEDSSVVLSIINCLSRYFDENCLDGEIVIINGGTSLIEQTIGKLKDFGGRISSLKNPYPSPNKDAGITLALNKSSAEDIVVIDSDIEDFDLHKITSLHQPLSKYKLVVPNLNRKGGRSNRLLGGPMLRLFFPEVYRKVPYPFPGMIGIKRNVLEEIVSKEFLFDWGGELQIIVEGYYLTGGEVISPNLSKKDRKRSVGSMLYDAYQIFRASLYLASKYEKLNCGIEELLKQDIQLHEIEANSLIQFCKRIGIPIRNAEGIMQQYNYFTEIVREDVQKLPKFLVYQYEKTKRYEFYTLGYLVAKPLIEMLYGQDIELKLVDKPRDKVVDLSLQEISFYSDIIIASIINDNIQKFRAKNFNYFLQMLDSDQSYLTGRKDETR